MTQILIRPFKLQTDAGFIYGTLPKAIFYESMEPIPYKSEKHFINAELSSYLKNQIENSRILIASPKEAPDLIIGYSIINGSILEFVYVKLAYRNHGIASLLTKNQGLTSFNPKNLTKIGHLITNEHPSLFKPKEESKEEESPNAIHPLPTPEAN